MIFSSVGREGLTEKGTLEQTRGGGEQACYCRYGNSIPGRRNSMHRGPGIRSVLAVQGAKRPMRQERSEQKGKGGRRGLLSHTSGWWQGGRDIGPMSHGPKGRSAHKERTPNLLVTLGLQGARRLLSGQRDRGGRGGEVPQPIGSSPCVGVPMWGCPGRYGRCLQGGACAPVYLPTRPEMGTAGVFQADSRSFQQAASAHIFLPQNSSDLS